ncbi:MAG: response regulator [Deltaproteobacteria bacterium]|nr:response regulator [Deltaproteobacteria bacterium]
MTNSPVFLGNETILLVEDEELVREFLADALTTHGYTVIMAEDGQDAVNKYKESLGPVDIVLMDVMMPRKDGVSAHKEISEFDPNSKIILMSGYTSESLGCIENINFIQKPMLPSIMFKQIREALDLNTETLLVPTILDVAAS